MTIARLSLKYSGLFEAELLLELMLRFWKHPLAADREFRNNLIECAAEALRAAIKGIVLIDGLDPNSTNFVAAVWYSEFMAVDSGGHDLEGDFPERRQWLENVRKSLPSCFCDPDDLT